MPNHLSLQPVIADYRWQSSTSATNTPADSTNVTSFLFDPTNTWRGGATRLPQHHTNSSTSSVAHKGPARRPPRADSWQKPVASSVAAWFPWAEIVICRYDEAIVNALDHLARPVISVADTFN